MEKYNDVMTPMRRKQTAAQQVLTHVKPSRFLTVKDAHNIPFFTFTWDTGTKIMLAMVVGGFLMLKAL